MLGEQGLDQIWEAAWKGQPHELLDELTTESFESWLFGKENQKPPQKVDDDDLSALDDLFD